MQLVATLAWWGLVDDRTNRTTMSLRFAGDRFEMQDHRNWCDANWKTYGTPLEYTGGCPLIGAFDDEARYIADPGDSGGVSADAFIGGRLLRVDVGVRGMPVFRGALA